MSDRRDDITKAAVELTAPEKSRYLPMAFAALSKTGQPVTFDQLRQATIALARAPIPTKGPLVP